MELYKVQNWGIALLLVVSLTGCGADATSGQQALRDGFTATDSSEIFPEMQTGKKETASLITAPAARNAMVPANNIFENMAKMDSLTKFSALLKKSEMVQKLNGTGPYTVFAPSDVALKAKYGQSLKELMKPENKERLQQLVSLHLIAGNLTVADLDNGATLVTAGGQQLRVAKKGGQVRINDAMVSVPDATCRNGVVHLVDRVLEPVAQQN